jgi:formylglycine-generating enzyme required for sulfatase activity
MVPVPGGVFRMGSPDGERGRKKDEGPQIEVEVEPFHMGKFEVTWPEYKAFSHRYNHLAGMQRPPVPRDRLADAVTYPTPIYEVETDGMLQDMGGQGARFPAVSVSQFAARQYTKWLSKKTGRFYRLPTEAEWEYACRAGTKTAYGYGEDPSVLGAYAVYVDNSEYDTGKEGYRQVGLRRPNAWGVHDMHGNVAEWCIDAYDENWYARFAGRTMTASEVINWPSRRYPRVLRGGGWQSEAADCRSASRIPGRKDLNLFDAQLPKSPHWETNGFWVGFRVVSPAREPAEADKLRFWNADDPVTIEVLQRDREIQELIKRPGAKRGATAGRKK